MSATNQAKIILSLVEEFEKKFSEKADAEELESLLEEIREEMEELDKLLESAVNQIENEREGIDETDFDLEDGEEDE